MRITHLFLAVSLLTLLLSGCRSGNSEVQPGDGIPSTQTQAAKSTALEIPIGMSASQVSQRMGAADSTGLDSMGRETWTYSSRGSNYVYSAERNGERVLIINGYASAGSLATYIVITFDPGKRVVDFTYQQRMF